MYAFDNGSEIPKSKLANKCQQLFNIVLFPVRFGCSGNARPIRAIGMGSRVCSYLRLGYGTFDFDYPPIAGEKVVSTCFKRCNHSPQLVHILLILNAIVANARQ